MAKKKLALQSTSQMVLVMMLFLSLVFNFITFTMLLDETRARTQSEVQISKVLTEHRKCLENTDKPCKLSE